MHIVFWIGRIMVGGYFLMAALNHFKNLSMYAGYVLSKGTPAPKLAIGGTGVCSYSVD
jgi:putative oxidoreductase